MNRRRMLANTVTGFGAATLAGLSSLQATACEGEGAVARPVTKGQVCPYYPCMFFGSYTMYYGLLVEDDTSTPPNLICKTPKALNGPNSLLLGCGGGGCGAVRVKAGERTGGHQKVKDYGFSKYPNENCPADDTYTVVSDEVEITCDDPGKPGTKISVYVKLFKLTVDTKNIDLAHLDVDVADALKKMVRHQFLWVNN